MPTCAMRKACTHPGMPPSSHGCVICKKWVHSFCFQAYNDCGDTWDRKFFCGPRSTCLDQAPKASLAMRCAAGDLCTRAGTTDEIIFNDGCEHIFHMMCMDKPCSECPKGKGSARANAVGEEATGSRPVMELLKYVVTRENESALANAAGMESIEDTRGEEAMGSGPLTTADDDLEVVPAPSGGSGSFQPPAPSPSGGSGSSQAPAGELAVGAGGQTNQDVDLEIVPAPSSGSEVSQHVSADKPIVAGALPGAITQVLSVGSASAVDQRASNADTSTGSTPAPTSGGAASTRSLIRNPYESEVATCPPGGASRDRQLAVNPYESNRTTRSSGTSKPNSDASVKRSPRTRSASQKEAASSAPKPQKETLVKVAPFDDLALQSSVHNAVAVSVKDTIPAAIKDAVTKEIASPGFAVVLSKASSTPALNAAVKTMVKEVLASSVKTMVATSMTQVDTKVTKLYNDALKAKLESATKGVEEAVSDLKTTTKKMVDAAPKNKPAGKKAQVADGALAEATTARLVDANKQVRDDIATVSSSLTAQGVADKAEMQAAFIAHTSAARADVLAAVEERNEASKAAVKEMFDTHRDAVVVMQAEAKKSMEEFMSGLMNRASQFICSCIVDANTARDRGIQDSVDAVKSEMILSKSVPKRQHETNDEDIEDLRRRRRSAPLAPSRGMGMFDAENISPSHGQLAPTHQRQMVAPNSVVGYPYGHIPGTMAPPAIPGIMTASAMHHQGVQPRFPGFPHF